jgi:hypothetical protein
VPFSFLGAVSILSVPIMILVTPFWNRIIRKTSWFQTIAIALFLFSSHYFLLTFVNLQNYLVLYTAALLVNFVNAPGVSIVISNHPYYHLPEEGRSGYLAFFAAFNSCMAMTGMLIGSLIITATGSITVRVAGQELINKQYFLMLVGSLLLGLSVLYHVTAQREKRQTAQSR